ncbi:hypothetical protein MTO96_033401 [Rhipicephalus appendiculatus]
MKTPTRSRSSKRARCPCAQLSCRFGPQVPSSAAGSRARGSSLAAAESCSRRRTGEASPACPALGLSAGVAAAGALLPHPPRSTATRSAVSSAPTMAAQTPGGVAPLPPRYRFRDLILGDFAYGDDGTSFAFLLIVRQ